MSHFVVFMKFILNKILIIGCIIQRYFCTVNDFVEKGEVTCSNNFWNPKTKLGVTGHFSELNKQQ